MKNHVIAVFDLDGTLTNVRSVESVFFRYLLRKRRLSFSGIFYTAVFYLENVLKSPALAIKKNKMYLKGLSAQEVDLWAGDFMKEYKNKLLNNEYLKLVKNHKSSGHTTILITGAPEFLVKKLFDASYFDYVYPMALEISRNTYTGHISGNYYYGNAKKDLMFSIIDSLKVDIGRSYCYADSGSDIEVMSLFGNPVAVNPDTTLKQKAFQNHWKIL